MTFPPDGTVAETTFLASRGRKKYILRTLQNPTQARACGRGLKSTQDRRPIDPPPIVQLTIFEEVDGRFWDVTRSYPGEFLLFASIECRAIVKPYRATTASSANAPELTGELVGAGALMDQPECGIYFSFGDLSVRSEGMFRLVFTLFEKTTQEQTSAYTNTGSGDPLRHMSCQLSVKSRVFQVFNAKTFPGLMPSTSLSETMVAQGARLRVRRDIKTPRTESVLQYAVSHSEQNCYRPHANFHGERSLVESRRRESELRAQFFQHQPLIHQPFPQNGHYVAHDISDTTYAHGNNTATAIDETPIESTFPLRYQVYGDSSSFAGFEPPAQSLKSPMQLPNGLGPLSEWPMTLGHGPREEERHWHSRMRGVSNHGQASLNIHDWGDTRHIRQPQMMGSGLPAKPRLTRTGGGLSLPSFLEPPVTLT